MSFDSSDVSTIVGIGVTGAVAFGAMNMVNEMANPKKKKKKKKTQKIDLSFGDFY